jgi:transcriptional regulator with XRE-family HTH domain
MSFYSNFLTMCNNIGKTPSKVVTEVGLKKSAVTRWKAGGNPTDATAQKIADYFGVPVSELTEETKKAPTPEGEREITMDDFTYAFYKESKDLPDEKKKMLLDMARFMKSDIEKGKG